MKFCVSILSLLLGATLAVCSQTPINPESVVYDDVNNCYYVSCPSISNILKRDMNGSYSILVASSPDLQAPKGLCISGGKLFATDLTFIRCFDLPSGNQLWNIPVPGSSFLNDIVAEPSGTWLYASDNQANKIFRIEIATQTATPFVTSGVFAPNGLYYDASVNRLIVVEFTANATIKAVLISNQNITTLVASTPTMLDGITRDAAGYWYVSSWATNKIHRYHSTFMGTPVAITVTAGPLNGPADIFCNKTVNPNVLAIPSMNNNQVYFEPIITTGTGSLMNENPARLYPNPSSGPVRLQFSKKTEESLQLTISEPSGKQAAAFDIPVNSDFIKLDPATSGLKGGNYLLLIEGKTFRQSLEWIIRD